eukprot:3819624-Prymnesium_polylepis.1
MQTIASRVPSDAASIAAATTRGRRGGRRRAMAWSRAGAVGAVPGQWARFRGSGCVHVGLVAEGGGGGWRRRVAAEASVGRWRVDGGEAGEVLS